VQIVMKRMIGWTLMATLVLAGCDDGAAPPDPPELLSLAPATGTSGTEVRIDGTGFQTGATVRFGSSESPSVVLEGGAVFATAPAGLTLGTIYDVAVRNPDGGEAVLESAFEVVAPIATRVNGVTKPTGLQGMTVIIEGSAFGDDPALSEGHVYFETSTGTRLEATIADAVNDWTDEFIVTSVPQGVTDTSWLWVETATGATDTIEFRLIQSGTFSPSLINWTETTALPMAIQGLGAEFVPVEEGANPANYVFTTGGADSMAVPTDVVYRATVAQSGALGGSWTALTALPEARAYHASAAATAFTAVLDTTTTSAYLYVIGGQDAAGDAVSTVYVGHVDLDGAVTDWQTTTALPAPLFGASAALFRGFIYLTGGQDDTGAASASTWRAPIAEDGSLGTWEELTAMPTARAFHSFLNFGPFLYAVGGDSTTALPAVQATLSTGELPQVHMARINLRTGDLADAGWSATAPMNKGRSKHSTIFAGGSLFATSGIYSGQAGSSENIVGDLASDGTVVSWGGATGSETIDVELGISLYNQAAVTFIDTSGAGHVLVLGGARRDAEGVPSDAVVYY
jgi:hypothetical protein